MNSVGTDTLDAEVGPLPLSPAPRRFACDMEIFACGFVQNDCKRTVWILECNSI